ncbi:hypothetical protein ADICYQ_3335 [Cyclobacterium qasimii M12-11B]|uniref:Uncharacterized protein n=1 Tax=Cyclobacterium qasimii M12-11B TaxID=641524 RepID=S7VBV7_9BACT|nr:hypothetical protein ADICYQ_3335 [Cyclobacterium qasimii M12-11B]
MRNRSFLVPVIIPMSKGELLIWEFNAELVALKWVEKIQIR